MKSSYNIIIDKAHGSQIQRRAVLDRVFSLLEERKELIHFKDIITSLTKEGLFEGSSQQQTDLWSGITYGSEFEKFITVSYKGQSSVGLKKWSPSIVKPRYKRAGRFRSQISPVFMHVSGSEQKLERDYTKITLSHILSTDELNNGYFVSEPGFLSSLIGASQSGTLLPVNVYCYGGYRFVCWLHTEYHTINSDNSGRLKKYFTANGLSAGDVLHYHLYNNSVDPSGIFLYTAWQKDNEKYLREKNWEFLMHNLKNSSHLSIKDLLTIYCFHKDQDKICTEDIIQHIKSIRPEVAESSIRSAVSASKILRRNSKAPERNEPVFEDTKAGDIDEPVYLLSLIQKKDYVFNILRNSDCPLTAGKIAEKIARTLGLDTNEVLKLSFIDLDDKRIRRLESGDFTLNCETREAASASAPPAESYRKGPKTNHKIIISVIIILLISIIYCTIILL